MSDLGFFIFWSKNASCLCFYGLILAFVKWVLLDLNWVFCFFFLKDWWFYLHYFFLFFIFYVSCSLWWPTKIFSTFCVFWTPTSMESRRLCLLWPPSRVSEGVSLTLSARRLMLTWTRGLFFFENFRQGTGVFLVVYVNFVLSCGWLTCFMVQSLDKIWFGILVFHLETIYGSKT